MRTLFLALILVSFTQLSAQTMKTVEKITWFGQAAVSIDNNGQKIFIDPYQLLVDDAADLILITHSHGDHLSVEDVKMVVTSKTQFICPHECEAKLLEAGFKNIITIAPGEIVIIDGTEITAVPMYNVVKTNYHPKENGWIGFIVNVDGVKIYHAGDTERIPEMKDLDCDIVLLPLGQTYTMNSVEEAVEAALDTGAEIAIPIHYGMYEGTKEDALKFKELLDGQLEVVIL
jgi:L-ascorbate metabolism protein UlaG (beta-lactamase superfamily)